jgi:hypothetical protein
MSRQKKKAKARPAQVASGICSMQTGFEKNRCSTPALASKKTDEQPPFRQLRVQISRKKKVKILYLYLV